jgi:hypothetical protein
MGQGSFPPADSVSLEKYDSLGPPATLCVFLLQFRGCKNLPMARSRCSWPAERLETPYPYDSLQLFENLIFFNWPKKSAREPDAVAVPKGIPTFR